MMRRGRGYKAVANRYTRERALTLVKEEVDARLLGKRLEGECRLWLRKETGERKEVVLLSEPGTGGVGGGAGVDVRAGGAGGVRGAGGGEGEERD